MRAYRPPASLLVILFLLIESLSGAVAGPIARPAVTSASSGDGAAQKQLATQSSLTETAQQVANVSSSTSCTSLAASSANRLFLPILTKNSSNFSAAATASSQQLQGPSPISAQLIRGPVSSADFAEATAFLYSGAGPVQVGVAAGAIDPQRAAVLRGIVCGGDGTAMSGVQIAIKDHPEFGSTLTQADGSFDMTVNGGTTVTVSYSKDGYLPAQRQVNAPWQDYAWLPDIVLIPLDTQVTTVDLSSSTPVQVARGSMVSDADGKRQATLLIPSGTQATLVLPGGGTSNISTLGIRATEYTVGASGPAAMPAELSAGTGYTYAVEYSVDQAQAAGATEVRFSQPLFHYVENFLNFPVGTPVPVGYYDRDEAAWVPSDNGQVIKILSISGGLAVLDTDGDGTADNGAALGVTDAERERLGALYTAGQTLWRVPITHFSPWDCNWPYGPPTDAQGPQQGPPSNDPPTPDPDCKTGSIIECQNQVLGEAVDVTGTEFKLHYQSDRVPGHKEAYSLTIPLSGGTIPVDVKRIDLEIRVDGQRSIQQFSATPNQQASFIWDGKDAYGRPASGQQRATVRVGYVYNAVYQTPAQFNQAFGALSGVPMSANPARQEVTLWQEWQGMIGGWDSRTLGLGGWSLSVHHAYDPTGKVLYLGDGRKRTAEALNAAVISTFAGGGTSIGTGDGGPATQANLGTPSGLAIGPEGSLYIAEEVGQRIRRVSPSGIITTVAGTGTRTSGTNLGDGGLATNATLNDPNGVAIAPDGSIFIADRSNNRIRKVSPDGIITTVVGTGVAGYGGDGGPATQAQINQPFGLALAPDGTFYVADTSNGLVRRVGTNGIISTVAGTLNASASIGDGAPATQAQLRKPWRVAVGPDGSLYILQQMYGRVRKVGTDGIINTVAGNGTAGFSGDGGPAISAQIDAEDIAVAPDGSIYIADRNNYRVRWVSPDGIVNTIAGNGTYGFSGDGGLAIKAQFDEPEGIALGQNGVYYISDWFNQRVRRIAPPLIGGSAGDVVIPSEDRSEVYVFDSAGRHLRTLNALTGGVRYQFAYDSSSRLVSVTDGSGNTTAIERNSAGSPTAIVGPYGQRTTLASNADGYLTSITNPAGQTVQLAYSTGGMLISLTNARGNVYSFQYDTAGQLTRDQAPDGGYSALARLSASGTYTVSLTTALARTTSYRVESATAGAQRSVTTPPTGLSTELVKGIDGTRSTHYPNGTTWTSALDPDPRWGMLAPLAKSINITNTSGLTYTIQVASTAVLTDTNNPMSLTGITNIVRVNGRPYTSAYTATTLTRSDVSPAGRQLTATLDTLGRVTSQQIANLSPTSYSYDSHGRLATIQEGTGPQGRVTAFSYNSAGNLATITDPAGGATSFAYDAAGRLTSRTTPDGQITGYAYDADGNLTTVTPPGKTAHIFAYTAEDQLSAYTPPDTGGGSTQTAYTYNADRQMTRIARPDGQTVDFAYDSAGRLSGVTTSRGTTSYTYDATTGGLASITAPGGIGLAYTHDGTLRTSETWSGPVAGSLSYAYDNNYRVTATSLNGGNSITFQYDQDGLRTQAGDLVLTRNAANGLVTGTALGPMTDSWTYDTFGQPASYSAAYNGTAIYTATYTRDKLGRITQKTETIGGTTDTYAYTYDAAGRLVGTTKNGVATSSYTYDGNGNRVTGPGGVSGSYDNQDRLTQYGSATYTYTANGALQSKSVGGSTTAYQYDALGNLTAVSPPAPASTVSYLVDGRNRQIGKKVGSTLTQGLLYQGMLNPVAELDGSGNLVSRFVYGSSAVLPDYMIKNGATYRIIADNQDSPRLVVNIANGQIAQRMDYDEFGNVLSDSNPGLQPFGFAGGLYDPLTKLVRFGSRDYDAETGRWTAKDPVLFEGHQANLYAYVGNDPVNRVDPSGLQASEGLNYTPGPGSGGMCSPAPSPGPGCPPPDKKPVPDSAWSSGDPWIDPINACYAPDPEDDPDLQDLEVQR